MCRLRPRRGDRVFGTSTSLHSAVETANTRPRIANYSSKYDASLFIRSFYGNLSSTPPRVTSRQRDSPSLRSISTKSCSQARRPRFKSAILGKETCFPGTYRMPCFVLLLLFRIVVCQENAPIPDFTVVPNANASQVGTDLQMSPSLSPTLSTQSPTLSSPTSGPMNTETPTVTSNSSEIIVNTTDFPTMPPSRTFAPSNAPSLSSLPSLPPSISPSMQPTISVAPSHSPSNAPTMIPSSSPTEMPSMSPTHNLIVESVQFTQDVTLEGSKFFNETEIKRFELLMENYTSAFDTESVGRVNTTCEWIDQTSSVPPVLIEPSTRRLGYGKSGGGLNASRSWLRSLQLEQQNWLVNIQYRMIYASDTVNVSSYPTDFAVFINSDLDRVAADMNNLGIPVIKTDVVSELFSQTPKPTTSPQPSSTPTAAPTIPLPPTPVPSMRDSPQPTIFASESPSDFPTPLPTPTPTLSPTAVPRSEENATIIVIVVVVVASLIMMGLYIFYRRRKNLQERRFQTSTSSGVAHKRSDPLHPGPLEGSWNAAVGKSAPQKSTPHSHVPRTQYSPDGRGPLGAEGLISPSESLVSNQSLLSAGNSMAGDSGDEADTTQNLQDEFDQYKDQNLEKMRAEVEGNLSGFDGMMSQALTKALMDDDEVHVDPSELYWGGVGQQRGAEIEASALCEVMDWLKRNDAASIDRKRTFMQEMLNKMVSSVRHGVLGPDDASRAIHECAALLELQLASDLPVNTVIISGMRKTVTAANVIEAFREFGEIDDAAVASNQRGIGLVRFKTPKSVQRAYDKSVLEEVVVQDVAVLVRIVKEVGRR